jgi:hypothetical protein
VPSCRTLAASRRSSNRQVAAKWRVSCPRDPRLLDGCLATRGRLLPQLVLRDSIFVRRKSDPYLLLIMTACKISIGESFYMNTFFLFVKL